MGAGRPWQTRGLEASINYSTSVSATLSADGAGHEQGEIWKLRMTSAFIVMFQSFRTDRSGQTVQTQIRRAVWSRSTLFAIPSASFLMHYSKERPSCSTFRVVTANFRVSEILEILGFLRYPETSFWSWIRLQHTLTARWIWRLNLPTEICRSDQRGHLFHIQQINQLSSN